MAIEVREARAAESDERHLVEAAQRDPACFADLYERHFERVYAFVVRRVRDRSAAEDLTSEVFHQALANIRRFEWRGAPFGAWLLRIAANAIADRWQRMARERGTPQATSRCNRRNRVTRTWRGCSGMSAACPRSSVK
jgi:RNA polymerase sigma-70 factor (ECF subfamily)